MDNFTLLQIMFLLVFAIVSVSMFLYGYFGDEDAIEHARITMVVIFALYLVFACLFMGISERDNPFTRLGAAVILSVILALILYYVKPIPNEAILGANLFLFVALSLYTWRYS